MWDHEWYPDTWTHQHSLTLFFLWLACARCLPAWSRSCTPVFTLAERADVLHHDPKLKVKSSFFTRFVILLYFSPSFPSLMVMIRYFGCIHVQFSLKIKWDASVHSPFFDLVGEIFFLFIGKLRKNRRNCPSRSNVCDWNVKVNGRVNSYLCLPVYLVHFLFNELHCIHIKKKRYTLASVTAPPRRTTLMFTSCAFLSTSRFTLPSVQWSEWWVYFGGKKLVSTSCFMISVKTHHCWAF